MKIQAIETETKSDQSEVKKAKTMKKYPRNKFKLTDLQSVPAFISKIISDLQNGKIENSMATTLGFLAQVHISSSKAIREDAEILELIELESLKLRNENAILLDAFMTTLESKVSVEVFNSAKASYENLRGYLEAKIEATNQSLISEIKKRKYFRIGIKISKSHRFITEAIKNALLFLPKKFIEEIIEFMNEKKWIS